MLSNDINHWIKICNINDEMVISMPHKCQYGTWSSFSKTTYIVNEIGINYIKLKNKQYNYEIYNLGHDELVKYGNHVLKHINNRKEKILKIKEKIK